MKRFLAAAIVALALAGSAQSQVTVSYDEFGPMADQQRASVFDDLSPENRALIVRTHAERWLSTSRERLSTEQVGAVEEAIAVIQPAMYDEENREAEQAAGQELMGRLTALLTQEDIMQAFTHRGAYIPTPVDH